MAEADGNFNISDYMQDILTDISNLHINPNDSAARANLGNDYVDKALNYTDKRVNSWLDYFNSLDDKTKSIITKGISQLRAKGSRVSAANVRDLEKQVQQQTGDNTFKLGGGKFSNFDIASAINTNSNGRNNKALDYYTNKGKDNKVKVEGSPMTGGSQIDNTNVAVANAKVGDWLINTKGQKRVISQGDIDWAKQRISSQGDIDWAKQRISSSPSSSKPLPSGVIPMSKWGALPSAVIKASQEWYKKNRPEEYAKWATPKYVVNSAAHVDSKQINAYYDYVKDCINHFGVTPPMVYAGKRMPAEIHQIAQRYQKAIKSGLSASGVPSKYITELGQGATKSSIYTKGIRVGTRDYATTFVPRNFIISQYDKAINDIKAVVYDVKQ